MKGSILEQWFSFRAQVIARRRGFGNVAQMLKVAKRRVPVSVARGGDVDESGGGGSASGQAAPPPSSNPNPGG